MAEAMLLKVAIGAMVGSTILGAYGQHQEGKAAEQYSQMQKTRSDAIAGQHEEIGKQEVALAGRKAQEHKRAARLKASEALAKAAASGAGAYDPDVMNIIAGWEEEGDIGSRMEMFTGLDRQRTRTMQAGSERYGGDIAMWEGARKKKASRLKVGTTILGGIGSASALSLKYG